MLVALRLFREGCYRISIISVFLCRWAKKNSNTLLVDRVLLLITLKAMKNIQRANATAYGSQMNLLKQKKYGTYQPGVFPKVGHLSSFDEVKLL